MALITSALVCSDQTEKNKPHQFETLQVQKLADFRFSICSVNEIPSCAG